MWGGEVQAAFVYAKVVDFTSCSCPMKNQQNLGIEKKRFF